MLLRIPRWRVGGRGHGPFWAWRAAPSRYAANAWASGTRISTGWPRSSAGPTEEGLSLGVGDRDAAFGVDHHQRVRRLPEQPRTAAYALHTNRLRRRSV